MARATTPSFIAEFPLRTTVPDERELATRLDAARNIYNAALDEALRVLDLMRAIVRQLPQGVRLNAEYNLRIPTPRPAAPQRQLP